MKKNLRNSAFAFSTLGAFLLGCSSVSSPSSDRSQTRALSSQEDGPVDCRKVAEVAGSTRTDCRVPTANGDKVMHLVVLKGDGEKISYDQGFLLAREIEEGLLKVATEISENNLKGGSAIQNIAIRQLFECYSNRLKRSIRADQTAEVKATWKGIENAYAASGGKPTYRYDNAIDAILGIEMATVAEGLLRRIDENPGVLAEVLAACSIERIRPSQQTQLLDDLKKTWGESPKLGGCIGLSVPAQLSAGNLMHGRNLDIDMVGGWTAHPTVFLVEKPGKNRFVAAAAAGMIFPGGIGGMNDQGLVVSLHEMSTDKYRSAYDKPVGWLAPRLAQRILEEAKSIDDAYRIAQQSPRFTSWTLFISDSKTGEVASIEFSADRVSLARRTKNETMAQTNHFIAPEMKDQAFTYNFNKLLESFSRLERADTVLHSLTEKSPVDVDWMIEQLASHEELVSAENYQARRAFGRTAVKAYNVASVIGIPAKSEIWSTLSEILPPAHSTFVGVKIDWDASGLTVIGRKRAHSLDSTPNWKRSMEAYVDARLAYTSYIGNNPEKSLQLLDQAISLAKQDGIEELPYFFMRARVHQIVAGKKSGEERTRHLQASRADWELLWNRRTELHPYGQALVALYSATTWDELQAQAMKARYPNGMAVYGRDEHDLEISQEQLFTKYLSSQPNDLADRKSRITFAINQLGELSTRYDHFDLLAKLKLAKQARTPRERWELPSLDFVVVEQ